VDGIMTMTLASIKTYFWVLVTGLLIPVGSYAAISESIRLADHPHIVMWMEYYRGQDRKVVFRQRATWALTAVAGMYLAYKLTTPSSATLPPQEPLQGAQRALELLKQPGLQQYIETADKLYRASENSYWKQWVYWTRTSLPGIVAGFAASLAYQIVVSPWASLINGPIFKKIYSCALADVMVNSDIHWWLSEQVVKQQHVRIPYITWWLVQELRVFDEAYRLQDVVALEQAAVKIYAQFMFVQKHCVDNEMAQYAIRFIAQDFADSVDLLRQQITQEAVYERCHNALRRVRLLESYHIIGSLF
jgi:hypothetical protein